MKQPINKTSLPSSDRQSFFRETITYNTLVGMSFNEADFRRVEARLASFERCRFVDCRFEKGNFTYARFLDCDFEFSDDAVVERGSFSGAVFERCKFSPTGRLRFSNCSFRDGHFVDCLFGEIDFTSNGLEDAYVEGCSFKSIDLRSVTATALMFSECRFGKLQISIENLVSVIGLTNLDEVAASYSVEILSPNSVSDALAVNRSGLVEMIKNEASPASLDPFQQLNALLILSTLRDGNKPIENLNAILANLETQSPLFAYDQLTNIIKLLQQYGLLSFVDTSPINRLLEQLDLLKTTLPFSLVQRVLAACQVLQALKPPEFEIVFNFRSADSRSSIDRMACYRFVEELRDTFDISELNQLVARNGSFKVSEYIQLKSLSPWLVVLIFLMNNSSIGVSLDLNKLPNDLLSAANGLADSIDTTQVERLAEEAAALDLQIEILKRKAELNRLIVAEELASDLAQLGHLYADRVVPEVGDLP